MSSHAAAMTLFVPICPLGTRVVHVAGEAAVVTVPTGALTGEVAVGPTKEAGLRLLFSRKDTAQHEFTAPVSERRS